MRISQKHDMIGSKYNELLETSSNAFEKDTVRKNPAGDSGLFEPLPMQLPLYEETGDKEHLQVLRRRMSCIRDMSHVIKKLVKIQISETIMHCQMQKSRAFSTVFFP